MSACVLFVCIILMCFIVASECKDLRAAPKAVALGASTNKFASLVSKIQTVRRLADDTIADDATATNDDVDDATDDVDDADDADDMDDGATSSPTEKPTKAPHDVPPELRPTAKPTTRPTPTDTTVGSNFA
jgi:hypothetical protein